MRNASILVVVFLMTAMSIGFIPSHGFAQTVDPSEASLRLLRRTVSVQRDGSHLSLLFALRQLQDPDLKPFFQQLLASDQWQMQVHAALGLGEIDPNKQLDPAFIEKLAPLAQDAVVATALDLQLLPHDRIAQTLEAQTIQPMAQLVLLAELVSPPVNASSTASTTPATTLSDSQRQRLRTLLDSNDNQVAGLASCLLAQIGELDGLAAFRSHITTLETQRSNDLKRWLLDAIRRYRLTACVPWVTEMLSPADTDVDLAYRGVFTLLELNPAAGLEAWRRALGAKPSYQQRVKFCNLLLSSVSPIPVSTYDQLLSTPPNPDELLIARMVDVGRSISTHGDIATALIQLLTLEHHKSSEWAIEYAADLPPEQAALVYWYLLDRANDNQVGSDAVSRAVFATPKLFAIDSTALLERLRQAPDDGVLQQAMLLGLFEVDSSAIGEAAASLRRIGSGRADSLALLLLARHATTLEKNDIDQLGKIAAGGGGLSEVLQIQAAWLFLKHTGQSGKVLQQLFVKSN